MGKLTGTFSSAHCSSNGCTMNTDEGVACLLLWCQELILMMVFTAMLSSASQASYSHPPCY